MANRFGVLEYNNFNLNKQALVEQRFCKWRPHFDCWGQIAGKWTIWGGKFYLWLCMQDCKTASHFQFYKTEYLADSSNLNMKPSQ